MNRWLPRPKRYFVAVLQMAWMACQAHQGPSDVVFTAPLPAAGVHAAQ